MPPRFEGNAGCQQNDDVILGPDLNASRTPLDKKLYRQIILKKNGLRVILISDTVAMNHQDNYEYCSDSDDDDDDDDDVAMMENSNENDEMGGDEDHSDDGSEDDSFEDDGLRKAAAAVVVGAGSFHDPSCAQGMAHFLEHMLFMGTSKYPGENEYSLFLSKNSGCDNAYTELEYTLYHMEVCQEKFSKALDMLSQFFVSPLMLQDAVDRELNAIESEFMLSKNSDECRWQQLLCHDCIVQSQAEKKNEKHPFSSFTWGNIESLKSIPEKNGVNMMKELQKFYNRHYYAQNMSVVVIGAYTLDKLEKHVVESFSDVPALPRIDLSECEAIDQFYDARAIKRVNAGTWDMIARTPIQDFGMPFQAETLGRITRIVPVKDRHSLSITWQISPQWKNWKSKPCDYIAHLLGHEAQGSLLSALKKRSWVNSCSAGVGTGGYESASSHALFCMQLTLSTEGVSYWAEIVKHVYIYIGMLRYYCKSKDGLPSWIFEELQAIQKLSHQFEDETTSVDLVEYIAESLTPYNCLPPERLLDGVPLLFEDDPNVVEDLLDNYFTPANARVDLMSSTFGRSGDFDDHVTHIPSSGDHYAINSSKGDAITFHVDTSGEPLIEPIFGSRYWSHIIPEEIIKDWNKTMQPQMPPTETEISLPPMNPFIPEKFDLKELPHDDGTHPLLFCSLKVCVPVGKKKAWFPCTANKFDGIKNRMLLGMEDGEENWHSLDLSVDEFKNVQNLKDFEGTFDEKKIKYKVIAVAKEGEGATMKYGDESDWHVEDGLHFPHIPPPLPESRLPCLLVNTQILKLWFLQDRKFKRPIGELRIKIACANANKTPLHKACAELMALLLHDASTELCYLASVCELHNEIQTTDVGFALRIHGFDDKIPALAKAMLSMLFSFCSDIPELPESINEHRFEACLEILRRRYRNSGMNAGSLCSNIRLRCLRSNLWSSTEKLNSVETLTMKEFMVTMAHVMTKVSTECLHHGNFDKSDAKAAEDIILEGLSVTKGMQKKQHPKQEVVVLPQSARNKIVVPTIDPKEPNTAVEVYFQCGKDSVHERVVIDLLVGIMDDPLYDQLRTKEQFGYSVSCGARWTYGIVGLCFQVTTSCRSADEVSERIEKFLTDFRADLVEMSNETFFEHVVSLAKDKLQMWNSLEEETGSLWAEIAENRYDFEVHRNEASALKTITKSDLLKVFDKYLSPDHEKRRKLEVHAIGTSEGLASSGRPCVGPDENVGEIIDEQLNAYRKIASKTWGTIY